MLSVTNQPSISPSSLLATSVALVFSGCLLANTAFNAPARAESVDTFRIRLEQQTYNPNEMELDVEKVVKLTVNQNLGIALADVEYDQASGEYLQTLSKLMPNVTPSHSLTNFRGGEVIFFGTPAFLDFKTHRLTLAGDMTLNLAGKEFFDEAAARHNKHKFEANKDSTLQEQLLTSLTRYYEWRRNSAAIDQTKQSLAEAEGQVKYNELRYDYGFSSEFSVLQSKTILQDRKSDVVDAEALSNIAKAELISQLNLPYIVEIAPPGPNVEMVDFYPDATEVPMAKLVATANEMRPDLIEAEEAVRQKRQEFRSAYADVFPDVSFSAFTRGIGPELGILRETNSYTFQLTTNVLQGMGVNAYGNIKAAKAELKQALTKQKQLQNQVQKNITRSLSNIQRYKKQLDIAEEKMKVTEEAFRIAKSRLKSGVGINLEVTQAQSDLADARVERQAAAASYNIAQLELLFTTGQLTPSKVLSAVRSNQIASIN